jgi:hypothetical protein
MKYSILQNIKIKTSKGGLELLPGQVATLPNSVANKLLNEGRITPCDIALEPISDEILQDVYLKTMNKINDSYIEGTIKYIKEQHKALDNEINRADDRVNEVWKECIQGKVSLDDFKAILNLYKELYLQGISLYKLYLQKYEKTIKC